MEVRLLSGTLSKATHGSAGYDLRAAEPRTVPARGRVLVPTGVRTAFDSGMVALIRDRSGLALKGIVTGGGVVDSDFENGWGVILFNHTDADFLVAADDRIAQVLFLPLAQIDRVGSGWEIGTACRGTGGFGSTGK